MRQLKLFQVVDADWIIVALARQNDFHKIGDDTELVQFDRSVLGLHWYGLVGSSFCLSAWNVVSLPNALCHFRDWKAVETAAHVAARITILQASGKNQIECGSRNYSELPELGNCLRKPPTGNAGTHSALNDRGKIAHSGTAKPRIISEMSGSDCPSSVIDTFLSNQ